MSDQHAAAALTAAAAIALVLITRTALLRSSLNRTTGTARPHRRWTRHPAEATPPDEAALAVREAEQHVHRCWQHLHTRTDPPE
ncbi:hypothetical protein AB0K92_33135 [Streptomyces sp. NPDC052687]|uniref:hypothetical protein n=1 Tax=Streptomyces sp. NPDC052687 TaxID=3154759 RepID=UPI00342CC0F1